MSRNIVLTQQDDDLCMTYVPYNGTDQTTQIQAAFDGRGTLCFDPQNYMTTSTITMREQTRVIAYGTTFTLNGSPQPILAFDTNIGRKRSIIEGITLAYPSAQSDPLSVCLLAGLTTDPFNLLYSIKNIRCINGTQGIAIGQGAVLDVNNVLIENCSGVAFDFTPGPGGSEPSFNNIHVKNSAEPFAMRSGSPYVGNLVWSDSTASNVTKAINVDNMDGFIDSITIRNVNFSATSSTRSVVSCGGSSARSNIGSISFLGGSLTLTGGTTNIALVRNFNGCTNLHNLYLDPATTISATNIHSIFNDGTTGRIYNRCANPLVVGLDRVDNNPSIGIRQFNGQWLLDPELP